ncbi:hypothetical protein FIBSPDRAFT_1035948 [Athelia psychrophila]|uniref:Transmembrane protein n=1 Tax=Athelia psychrophila TaxID=1759441 RepID=A0A166WTY0_9AGAM|nr:hypothetical protein FIBSPDRAFT_1035948 [Fibularhizoctonia sp. CBS 109695]
MPSLSRLSNLTESVSTLSQLAAAVTETDTQAKCIDITHCRTIWNIIWSCLATIFACAWVAVHRNVPDPTSSLIRVNLDRVAITICALLVPEYMVGWAVRQWLVARRIAEGNEALVKLARDTGPRRDSAIGGEMVWHNSLCEKLLEEAIQVHDIHKQDAQAMEEKATKAGVWMGTWYRFYAMFFPNDDPKWTTTHGFFTLMGGFYYLDPGRPPRPLSPVEVAACITDGSLELPKESDISDKSKGDALSKFFALLQTIWFVVQSIARPLQKLPLTKLEIATLAYTSINVAMYGFWWYKPLGVSRPVRVRRFNADPATTTTTTESTTLFKKLETLLKAVMGSQDDDANFSKLRQVPAFYAGKPTEWESIVADAIALAFAMVFGAVHCVAWAFAFPSHAEMLIWRIASIALVGVPAIFIFLIVLWACELKMAIKSLLILSLIGIPFYLLARVMLLVLAFTTLRSLPLAAFETVHWITFIPHI